MRANFVMSGVAPGIRRNLPDDDCARPEHGRSSLVFVGSAFLTSTEISRFKHDCTRTSSTSRSISVPTRRPPCTRKVTAAETAWRCERQLQTDPRITSVSLRLRAAGLRARQAGARPGHCPVHRARRAAGLVHRQAEEHPEGLRRGSPVNTSKQPGVDKCRTRTTTHRDDPANIIDSARLLSIVGAVVVLFCAII